MSSPKALSINQKISVSKAGSEEWYISQILDLEQDLVYIALPYRQLLPLILQPDERVSVFFATEDAGYQFDTIVTGVKEDQVLLYIIKYPVKFTRIQLREFVRLPICLDVAYAKCQGDRIPAELTLTSTRDLSAGGMQLVTKKPLQQGDLLFLRFVLKHGHETKMYQVRGEVVRAASEYSGSIINLASVKFINLAVREQDSITGFIFVRMIERRKAARNSCK